VRVLVTGGAGFIGSALVRKLLADGHDVVILDDLSTGFEENLRGVDVPIIHGSVTDSESVSRAASGCHTIVHLAAVGSVPQSIIDPIGIFDINVRGSLEVFEYARREGAHVIFSSSASVFGTNPENPKTSRSWTRPMSPYGSSKLAAESYLLSYAACFGFPALAFRFFNVYGPRQRPDHPYAAAIPRFMGQALLDLPVTIYGDGRQDRDFVSVGLVSSVIAEAVRRTVSSDVPVNMSTGTQTAIIDVAKDIIRLSNSTSSLEMRPARDADIRFSQGSPDDLMTLFPNAVDVSLADGLVETMDWMRTLAEAGDLSPTTLS
jgi:UDP-glucose 4-epimerase